MSDGNKQEAEAKFTKLSTDVEREDSMRKVTLALTRFKSEIDSLCDKKKGCGGSIAASSAVLAASALLGAGLLLKKKHEDK